MARYIDADVTLKTLKEILIETAINNVGYKRDVDEVCKDIADNRLSIWLECVPTADVREVVQGEWISSEDCLDDECSICHKAWNVCDNETYKFLFCPNCGADMRGGKE